MPHTLPNRDLQKPRKPFRIRQMHLDIGTVLMHHHERALDHIDIFEELYHSTKHHGWEIEFGCIMAACNWLANAGYIDNHRGSLQANENTASLFDKVTV